MWCESNRVISYSSFKTIDVLLNWHFRYSACEFVDGKSSMYQKCEDSKAILFLSISPSTVTFTYWVTTTCGLFWYAPHGQKNSWVNPLRPGDIISLNHVLTHYSQVTPYSETNMGYKCECVSVQNLSILAPTREKIHECLILTPHLQKSKPSNHSYNVSCANTLLWPYSDKVSGLKLKYLRDWGTL